MILEVPILEDLRKLVDADGRARKEIAAAAGIHETTFSTFMSGRRGLDIATAEKLAAALGTTLRVDAPKPKRKAKA